MLSSFTNLKILRKVLKYLKSVLLLKIFRNPSAFHRFQEETLLKQKLAQATSFEAYRAAANDIDAFKGLLQWKDDNESHFYDNRIIEANLKELRLLIQCEDIRGIVRHLRSRLLRNLGGIGSIGLYATLLSGTKSLIEDYVDEICFALKFVLSDSSNEMSNAEKLAFFSETRHSYGRTALFFSGGAGLGLYHLGAIKALLENRLLPRIITGSSAGSFFAGCLATRTDSEVESFLNHQFDRIVFFDESPGSLWRQLNRLVKGQSQRDILLLEKSFKEHIGDYTFAEAFIKTQRIVNIVIAPETSKHLTQSNRILNHVTAPDVLIWSACVSSCAIPFVYDPYELQYRSRDGKVSAYFPSSVKWSDGSFGFDVPTKRMAHLFNVNHSIVIQVNPHLIPFALPEVLDRSGHGVLLKAYDFFSNRFMRSSFEIIRLCSFFINSLQFTSKVMAQTYTGDITIIPDVNVIQEYQRLLTNATKERWFECTKRMEQCIFRHLSRIQNQCCIEYLLDDCVHHIRMKMMLSKEIDISHAQGAPTVFLSKTKSFSFEEFISYQAKQMNE